MCPVARACHPPGCMYVCGCVPACACGVLACARTRLHVSSHLDPSMCSRILCLLQSELHAHVPCTDWAEVSRDGVVSCVGSQGDCPPPRVTHICVASLAFCWTLQILPAVALTTRQESAQGPRGCMPCSEGLTATARCCPGFCSLLCEHLQHFYLECGVEQKQGLHHCRSIPSHCAYSPDCSIRKTGLALEVVRGWKRGGPQRWEGGVNIHSGFLNDRNR